MGSTWKCTTGASRIPSARLQGHGILGLGEGHDLTNSSLNRDTRVRFSVGSWASRRTLRNSLGNPQNVCNITTNSGFKPGCASMGWSQRLSITTTHASNNNNNNNNNNNSNNNAKSARFDSSEEMDCEEKNRKGGSSAFQDFSMDGDEPFVNGEYMRLSRGDESDASDLFREDRDSQFVDNEKSVWPDAGILDESENGAGSDGFSSWDGQIGSVSLGGVKSAADSLAIGGKEPVYKVLEIHPGGDVVHREVSRRQLLRSIAGLRLRDIRSVDPSLWVTNSVPAILVRDQAILLNLGSLKAIATPHSVLIFEHGSVGAEAFMGALLPRLRTATNGNGPIMPFELEVVEAALISRTQRLERMLMDVEPRVMASLKVLPIRYTGDVLEELRLGKQALVELAAKAGALRQMLLEFLEHPEDIRKMTIMGRTCRVRREDGSVECTLPLDKQTAEDEEEEIEMLLEYYLQRCDSCHGQAEKLLDAAKEMEDSIGVNLSSRRLEVSRLELLLQVGTFCSALGALVAGIFGMNLKSYLEERALAFYITTAAIVFGGIALFMIMLNYLKGRKIL